MESSIRAHCEWKCSAMSCGTEKWHTGSVSLNHTDDGCWLLKFYIAVKHSQDVPRCSARLNDMITKLLVQKERIILNVPNAMYSFKFRSDAEKEKIASVLTEIKNRPCPHHSGLHFSNASNYGGLRSIGSMANSQNMSGHTKMLHSTPAKENAITSTQSASHIKTPSNNFTRVKDHSLSPLDERVDNSSPFERTYSSTGKGSENKKRFLESSALKSDKIISLPDFYGNRASLNGLTSSSGNFGIKRKPGFLSLNDGEGRKSKLPNTALMSTRKQNTLDDMNFKRGGGAQLQGFSNLGNTCYMNSILQSLFCLLPFVSDLVAASQKLSSSPRDNLCLALVRLLHAPDAVAERERLLAKVKDTVSKSARRFSGHEQHDAHEFLSQVLDQLKDEVSAILKTLPTDQSPSDAQDSDPAVCNPTIQNFESEIQQMITCTKCKQEYCSTFIMNDISLDVPQGIRRISLHDCIRHYFKPHSVEYNCRNCSNNSGLVTYHFLRLPRIFILLLKRYKFNSVMTNHRKIVENIVIPQYISLSDHCGTDTKPPNKLSLYQANGLQHPKRLCQWLKERFTFKKKVPSSFKDKSQNDGKTGESQDGQSKSVKYYDEEQLKDMSDEVKLAIALNLSCNGLENGAKVEVNSANSDSYVVDTLELTCEAVDTEMPKDPAENASPELSETPIGSRHDASWIKSLTPDKSGTPSVKSLKRRVSKELFPVADFQTPEEPVQPLVEGEITKDFGSPNHTAEASAEGVSERKRARLSDPFDASTIDEDKENVLPSLFDDANPKPSAGFGEGLSAGVQQTEEQFDADMKLAIALSLQNQEEEQERIKQMNSDEDDNCDECEDPLLFEAVGVKDTEEQIKAAQMGLLPHSYHLMSIVSHIGGSSSNGHYVTDLYDFSSKQWYSCDDSTISPTSEENVQKIRQSSGYIFFYLSKELDEEVKNIKQS